jgi:hypothetical protein
MLIREYLGAGVDIVAVFGYSELKQGEITDELIPEISQGKVL